MFKGLTKILNIFKSPAEWEYSRGHKIAFGGFSDKGHPIDGIFEETGKPVTIEDHKHLPCIYCGREPISEGRDVCKQTYLV